jgi:protein-tyrosine phosphatase
MGEVGEMIDLHSHILHGLDDGARSLEESLRMCEIGYRDGIRTIVATPHTLNGVYQNNRSTILAKVKELNTALEESHFLLDKRQNEKVLRSKYEICSSKTEKALTILPGADVHLCQEMLSQLDEGKVTTIGDGGKSLLIEFPSQRIPYGAEEVLLQLIERGVIPVITHPERNMDVLQRPQRYHEMIRMGCLGQVTATSLTGGFGPEARQFAEQLLKHRLLHVIASDAHSTNGRSPVLTSAVEAAEKIVGKEEAWRMVTEYPQAILEGRRPDVL